MKNIIIVAGGSGGHIFPAINLAKEIKALSTDANIIFISADSKLEKQIFSKLDFECINLSVEKIALSPRSFKSIIKFIKAFFKSSQILIKSKPSAAVGFGGYVTVPVISAAFLKKIPTIIHEQNVELGKANKLLSFLASKIAVSFTESKDKIKSPFIRKKIVLTGNPISKDFYSLNKDQCFNYFNFTKNRFVLLVLGGSQGSLKINKLVMMAIGSLPKDLIDKLQIIHAFGNDKSENLESYYKNLGVHYKLYDFLEQMHSAYCIADMAVSRAGATTIAELISFRIPSVLVPYPYAGKHQLSNAKILTEKKAALLLEENVDESKKLCDIIKKLMLNRNELAEMKLNLSCSSHKQAADNLAKEVLTLC